MENSTSDTGLLTKVTVTEKDKSKTQSFKAWFHRSTKLLGSLLARLLFLAHSIMCVVIAVASIDQPYIYILCLPLSLLIVEGYLTLKVRKNVEWKWFTPCIAIYQLCTVPSIWLMEYREYGRRSEHLQQSTIITTTTVSAGLGEVISPDVHTAAKRSIDNSSLLSLAGILQNETLAPEADILLNATLSAATVLVNLTTTAITPTYVMSTVNFTTTALPLLSHTMTAGLTKQSIPEQTTASLVYNYTVNISSSGAMLDGNISGTARQTRAELRACLMSDGIAPLPVEWGSQPLMTMIQQYCNCSACVPFMEQMLLLIMIVGRWLLPRGQHLTADQKAQLLLVNIAIAADILELFELLKEREVGTNFHLVMIVLILWSCSLIQFAIVATATAKKTVRGCSCFQSEIWSLVTLLLLDDAPFLLMRLVCIIQYDLSSYSSYFFTAKNLLVLALDVNRIIALYKEQRRARGRKRKSDDIDMIERRVSLSHIRR